MRLSSSLHYPTSRSYRHSQRQAVSVSNVQKKFIEAHRGARGLPDRIPYRTWGCGTEGCRERPGVPILPGIARGTKKEKRQAPFRDTVGPFELTSYRDLLRTVSAPLGSQQYEPFPSCTYAKTADFLPPSACRRSSPSATRKRPENRLCFAGRCPDAPTSHNTRRYPTTSLKFQYLGDGSRAAVRVESTRRWPGLGPSQTLWRQMTSSAPLR